MACKSPTKHPAECCCLVLGVLCARAEGGLVLAADNRCKTFLGGAGRHIAQCGLIDGPSSAVHAPIAHRPHAQLAISSAGSVWLLNLVQAEHQFCVHLRAWHGLQKPIKVPAECCCWVLRLLCARAGDGLVLAADHRCKTLPGLAGCLFR